MNFLFGKVERACGLLSNTVHRMSVEDSATVLMQLPAGVHAVVDVRWNSHVPRDQFRIIGEDGEINLDPLNGPELRINIRGQGIRGEGLREENRMENLPPHANLHYPAVENFVDAVLANDPARLACPAEQAAWVDWTIEQVVGEQVVRSQAKPS
jgi:predicted dehydrogenase